MSAFSRVLVTAFVCSTLLQAQPSGEPTLLLVNAKIWTADPNRPEAEAVAVAGNRILAVGTNEEIRRWKKGAAVELDLAGRRVLPGFNDSHVHLLNGGMNLAGPQLRFTKSKEEFRDTLSLYVAKRPSGEWITGGNWDHENWSPADLPTRQLIDDVSQGHPVMISRLDSHMSLANSAALRAAGVTRDMKDVPGGVIVRDQKGEPTGILKDAAQELVRRVIPAPTPERMREAIRAAQAYANALGVTSVQDMSAAPAVLRVYQQMLRAGELHLRISGHQPLRSWQHLADIGLQADFGNSYLHIGALKGYADGSLGSTTALLFDPYLDAPQTSGIPSAELADPKSMYATIEGADAAGLQIAVHAIGDKANATILDFYEKVIQQHGPRDRRLRIEHAQHLRPGDIARFGRDGVIASTQPFHLMDDGRWAEKRIGPERATTAYAFRTLLDTGAHLAFGSDWDVAPMSPLLGIYAATTRRTLDGKHPDGWTPAQKITVAEAVTAYTMGSAYASFEESEKGSITPGKLADFVVLSDDIFSMPPEGIEKVKVYLTIFDGKLIGKDPLEINQQRLPSGLILRP
jgi:predicted amidohydrolase YtcJ